MRPSKGRTKYKQDPKFPHKRSEGLTHRQNCGTRFLVRFPVFEEVLAEMKNLNPLAKEKKGKSQ